MTTLRTAALAAILAFPAETSAQAEAECAARTADFGGWMARGTCERARRDFDAALQAFHEAQAFAPDSVAPLIEVAVTYAWAGRLEQAHDAYAAAHARDPASSAAAVGLARVRGWQGARGQAREALLTLLGRDPSSAEAWLTLGDLELARQDTSAARTAFERADALGHHDQATQGLERVDAVRAWRIGVSGRMTLAREGPSGGGTARVEYAFGGEWAFDASYEIALSAMVTSDPSVAAATEPVHLADLGLARREPNARYGLRVQHQRVGQVGTYRATLAYEPRLDAEWTLLASVRPGMGETGTLEARGELGAMWASHGSWVLVSGNVMAAEYAGAPFRITGSGMAMARLALDPIGLRGAFSVGEAGFGVLFGGSLGLELAASRDLELALTLEGIGGAIERLSVALGATFLLR